jgi:hypothetical protein
MLLYHTGGVREQCGRVTPTPPTPPVRRGRMKGDQVRGVEAEVAESEGAESENQRGPSQRGRNGGGGLLPPPPPLTIGRIYYQRGGR